MMLLPKFRFCVPFHILQQISSNYICFLNCYHCGSSGNGRIDFGEFVQLLENNAHHLPDDMEMRAMFAAFDKDRSGYIGQNWGKHYNISKYK